MKTQIDKQELKNWIGQLDDQGILEGIQSLKESTETTLSWDNLPEVVKKGIEQGREDIKAGRVISNEEFWKKHEHLL